MKHFVGCSSSGWLYESTSGEVELRPEYVGQVIDTDEIVGVGAASMPSLMTGPQASKLCPPRYSTTAIGPVRRPANRTAEISRYAVAPTPIAAVQPPGSFWNGQSWAPTSMGYYVQPGGGAFGYGSQQAYGYPQQMMQAQPVCPEYLAEACEILDCAEGEIWGAGAGWGMASGTSAPPNPNSPAQLAANKRAACQRAKNRARAAKSAGASSGGRGSVNSKVASQVAQRATCGITPDIAKQAAAQGISPQCYMAQQQCPQYQCPPYQCPPQQQYAPQGYPPQQQYAPQGYAPQGYASQDDGGDWSDDGGDDGGGDDCCYCDDDGGQYAAGAAPGGLGAAIGGVTGGILGMFAASPEVGAPLGAALGGAIQGGICNRGTPGFGPQAMAQAQAQFGQPGQHPGSDRKIYAVGSKRYQLTGAFAPDGLFDPGNENNVDPNRNVMAALVAACNDELRKLNPAGKWNARDTRGGKSVAAGYFDLPRYADQFAGWTEDQLNESADWISDKVSGPQEEEQFYVMGSSNDTKAYGPYQQATVTQLLSQLASTGMSVSGGNPYDIDTKSHGVKLRAQWDGQYIHVTITGTGIFVSNSAVWGKLAGVMPAADA